MLIASGVLGAAVAAAEPAAEIKQGATLLKTDILGVFAHPDDETGMAGTLAYYARGRGATVVNIYCTRGEGGGNMVGTQWGAALGILRERELRDCLETVGVRSCFFLDRLDWAYTESASATLRKWDKEATLERLVRLVRALRPEVIVTMNPAPTPGQHGHHQSAGILAIEAFSAAADTNRFPLQIAREGLTAWQPRRLFLGGGNGDVVSTIPLDQPLSNGLTPGKIAAQALANHRSQAFGNFANSPWMQRPQKFTLVKAFAPLAGVENDLLGGLPVSDSAVAPVTFAKAAALPALEVEFVPRPAFANYQRWAKEQGIEHVATQFQADVPVVAGELNTIRVRVQNRHSDAIRGDLKLSAAAGWKIAADHQQTRVGGDALSVAEFEVTPPEGTRGDTEATADFSLGGLTARAVAKLHPVPRARVPRAASKLELQGSEAAWAKLPALSIAPTDIVEGKVADAADSSAQVRLAHDGKSLFVEVTVKDDHLVANIAPNDIRGHWRSDSVEICLDPAVGSEDTLGAFKMGIFPFDSTGVVRAERAADANQGPIEETAPKTRFASERTPEGYRIRVSIPFEEIGLPRGKRRLGFNVIVYDGDKPNPALGENINKSRIAWAPRPGVQGRPEDWGRIDLE